jgi:type I restriction-modification system DNA methylase subunit
MSSLNTFIEDTGRLAARFQKGFASFHSSEYDEASLRLQFLDPLFTALGWDVANSQGLPLHLSEVVIERRTNIAGRKKRADYVFGYAGLNKFVCEAKKPSEDLDKHAFQIQNYTYNLSLYLGVLTNFKELLIYVVGSKPDRARPFDPVLRLRFDTFEQNAAKLWDLLSRGAVADGSLEKFIQALPKTAARPGKQGWLFKATRTRTVDDDFLEFLDSVRGRLARSLARTNAGFDWGDAGLNEAVQTILDRILFIRICEDRDIDTLEPLEDIVRDWVAAGRTAGKLYPALAAKFRKLAPLFNGGLFGRPGQKAHFSESIAVDDFLLADLISELSAEDSNYLFSTIPVHILGSVYERFLGKVIRTTASGAVRIEQKPEVRKAGGVYYTPRYIVEHIVEQTVGAALKDKTPAEIAAVQVIDPACGSGSFLIRAFERICEHHLERLMASPSRQKRSLCYRDANNVLHLTTGFKRKILLNSIYGIDIDPQAVEVTQLSLYLKILEGETRNSLEAQQPLFPGETVLPDLSRNVHCGNSLVGTDFLDLFVNYPQAEALRPFSWEAAFPVAFTRGGFDVVIGNPPYLYSAGQDHGAYFIQRFGLSEYQTDSYVFFIEQGIRQLRRGGRFGMIVSDSWIKGKYFSKLRAYLLKETQVKQIVVFDYPPFHGATIENSIIILQKAKPHDDIDVYEYKAPEHRTLINRLTLADCVGKAHIDLRYSAEAAEVVAATERYSCRLEQHCFLNRGVHAYRTDGYGRSKFSPGHQTKRDKEEQSYHAKKKLDASYFPEVKGKHLRRYGHVWDGTYISYGGWLAEPRTPELFKPPKIAIRKIIAPRLVCTYIRNPVVLDQSVYVAVRKPDTALDLLFILGVLASSVGGWYLRTKHGIYDKLYPWFTKEQLAAFPLPCLDLERGEDRAHHDDIVALVRRMLDLEQKLERARAEADRTILERVRQATDAEIDRMVFELYGFSLPQIEIILGR